MEEENNWSGEPYSTTSNATRKYYCHNFTSTVRKYAYIARPTIATLGAIASIIGIIVIICLMKANAKKYRTCYNRLVLYLMISTLFVGIIHAFSVLTLNEDYKGVFYRDPEHTWNGVCAAIGYLNEMSAWLEHLAIAWITVYIILLVHPKTRNGDVVKGVHICEIGGIFWGLLTPILLCWIPFVTNTYGISGLGCWIKSSSDDCSEKYISGLVFQFLLYYVPFFFLVSFNIISLFIILCYYIWNYCRNHCEGRAYRKVIMRVIFLCLFPIVYDILFAVQFANRIAYALAITQREYPNYHLWLSHSVVDSGRYFYPPFVFLVEICVSYIYDKCKRGDGHENSILADLPASHGVSTSPFAYINDSETHIHFATEYDSSTLDDRTQLIQGASLHAVQHAKRKQDRILTCT